MEKPFTADDRLDEGAGRPPLKRGARVGRYVVEEALGQGGLGMVYAAYDPHQALRVSLELVPAAEGDQVVDSKARLQREAQALARLSHPNVVAVHDLGAWNAQVYVVMDLVRGTTLGHWLWAQERPWREIVRVFRDAATGLAAAHRIGLVHGDFKPANVRVDGDGRARVLGFGVARIAGTLPSGEAAVKPTHPGAAPEQHRGAAPDERADQFSFFASLYEALFGAPPYRHEALRARALHATAPELQPGTKGRDVPPAVRQVVLRGLSLDPAARFRSMGEARAALRSAAQGRAARFATAGAAVLLLAAWAVVMARGRTNCDREEHAFDGDWNAGRAAAIRSAFLATPVPYALSASDHVAERLNVYAEEWRGAAVSACAAAKAAGRSGEELWGRRKDCLTRLRIQAGALVQVFEHADRVVVGRAVQAAYGLERVSSCTSPAAFRAPAEAEAWELRGRAARVRALLVTAQPKEGLALAEPLAKDAARSDSRASLAEALELLGGLRRSRGDARGAEDALSRAITAAQAAGDELDAARLMAQLAILVGKGARAAEGRRWVELASAVVARDGPAPDLEAQVMDAKAVIDSGERKIDDAIAASHRAVELREQVLPAGHPDVARAYLAWGAVLDGAGHPARAEEAYGKALPMLQRAFGPEHPQVALALHALGAACEHQGRYQEALEWLEQAYVLRSRALGPEHLDVARALNDMGATEMGLGRYADALEHEMRALVIVERNVGLDHVEVATTLNHVAAARAHLGTAGQAEALVRHAMEMAVKDDGPDGELASTCWMSLGLVQQAQGHLDQAVESLRKSVEVEEKAKGRDHPATFAPLQALGGAQLRAGHPKDAVETLRRALAVVVEPEARAAKLADARMDLAKALQATGSAGPEARELATRAEQGFRDSERKADADAAAALARALGTSAPGSR
jgi:eukaryotic-like serine/threonine-protein kinase